MKKEIYLDHAATTYLDSRVLTEILPYFKNTYANPESLHFLGVEAKKALDQARKKTAQIINCQPEEIIFTSGGTESINLALKGIAFNHKRGHIITSKIEHPAVSETCWFLEKQGFEVTYLDVDKNGLVSAAAVEKAITKDTILISVMYANNEIGTIEPIQEIGKIARKHNLIFHTDACQAGILDLDVERLKVDLMTLNGSKIYGPKGVGILYKRKNILLRPLVHGGGQEFGLRSGTPNLAGIIGFAKSLELVQKERKEESRRLVQLRDYFVEQVLKKIPKTILNGHPEKRLPSNANISFLDVEGESILLYLAEKGICVSTGSACSSHKLEASYVLKAIGLQEAAAHGSIRFSFGKRTTKEDIDYTLVVLEKVIVSLRQMSPVKMDLKEVRK